MLSARAASHSHSQGTLYVIGKMKTVEEEDDDEDLQNPDPLFLNEEDWQLWASDHPAADIPHFTLGHLGDHPLDNAGMLRNHEHVGLISIV